ncbi:MAG: DUF2779 domain-containing protein, partial [Nanoarchaeota archaeon]|nr:DUF2779 domain-containing protein [Nanoarchaeota archaeon]
MKTLSKSNYLLGLTCPKSLWIKINQPEKLPEIDKSTQHRFDEGHIVGEFAKQLFPKGIEIKSFKYDDVINDTLNEIDKRVPLFEAGFRFNNCFTRPDIMLPVGKDSWEIYEVKSTTSVKEEHIEDLAFQKYVYENSGLKIKNYYVVYLDNEYVRKGKIDVKKLFIKENVTSEINKVYEGIEDRVKYLLDLINSKTYDEIKYGKHCDSPKTCPTGLDWEELPDHNVFELYRGGAKSKTLFDECDCLEIKDIPSRIKLTDKQKIQVDCVKEDRIHIEKTNIKNFLDTLEYPLYYIDFETYNPAIPMYNGLKPYQRIPFQFSLHIQKEPNGKLEHYEYLASENKDPREEFISHIKKWVGETGSIIVYNQGFEKGVMKEVSNFLPKYKKWAKELEPRYVDLLVVFRNFFYYN